MQTINIIGAGASGVFLALLLSQHKVQINIIDMGKKPCRKILISGGGFCNFTNYSVGKENYISNNEHFVLSALKGYSNWDFISLIDSWGIDYQIKNDTKLFTREGAKVLVKAFLEQIDTNSIYSQAKVNWLWQEEVVKLSFDPQGKEVLTLKEPSKKEIKAIKSYLLSTEDQQATKDSETLNYLKQKLYLITKKGNSILGDYTVIATGGLAMPRLLVSEWGKDCFPDYVESRPGLVPLAYSQENSFYKSIPGVSLPVIISNQDSSHSFASELLFTHKGISGPAVLQISNYWDKELIIINLLPQNNIKELIESIRSNKITKDTIKASSRTLTKNLLQLLLPNPLIEVWSTIKADSKNSSFIVKEIQPILEKQLANLNSKEIETISSFIHQHPFITNKDLGYDKAEVMLGGINTKFFSSKTMAALSYPYLYAIGEALDITGQLGGFNFQWCWSSTVAAYKSICKELGWESNFLI